MSEIQLSIGSLLPQTFILGACASVHLCSLPPLLPPTHPGRRNQKANRGQVFKSSSPVFFHPRKIFLLNVTLMEDSLKVYQMASITKFASSTKASHYSQHYATDRSYILIIVGILASSEAGLTAAGERVCDSNGHLNTSKRSGKHPHCNQNSTRGWVVLSLP